MTISCWIVLRMRNVSDKTCRENPNAHFMFNNFFFFWKSCHSWDNVEKCYTARETTDGNIKQRMRFPCWIIKATNTHSEYVIRIAFPQWQWLLERASVLHYTYIVFLVKICIVQSKLSYKEHELIYTLYIYIYIHSIDNVKQQTVSMIILCYWDNIFLTSLLCCF